MANYVPSGTDMKRQDAVNSVEQKFQRLSLPATNSSHSQVIFNVEQMGAGGSAIAAAASQAIAATQQVLFSIRLWRNSTAVTWNAILLNL